MQSLEQVKGLMELVVLGQQLLGSDTIPLPLLTGAFVTATGIGEMACKVGFGGTAGGLEGGDLSAFDDDIGFNTLGLDRTAAGGVVQRSGQLDRAFFINGDDGLDGTLAEAPGAQQHGA